MPLTEKGNEIRASMEKEYGPKKGDEVFYASRNRGTISGVDSMLGGSCDAVPIAKCYDQSYPPMDPTSIGAMPTMERGADQGSPQPSGMQEPTDAEQTPAEREQLRGELRYGKARHEGKITGQEHKGFIEAVHKNAEDEPPRGEEAARRAGPTGPEPPKDAFEPTTAGCDPAMSFDEAVFGPVAHDYGADRYSSMGVLPETVTHRQMQNFGASFNFGEGVTR